MLFIRGNVRGTDAKPGMLSHIECAVTRISTCLCKAPERCGLLSLLLSESGNETTIHEYVAACDVSGFV